MTLYTDIVAAGIETDSHESDLYVPDNAATRQLIAKHNIITARPFRNEITGDTWLDVPFQYDPFWTSRP